MPDRRWSTEQIDRLVGGLLQSGVLLAAAVAVVGVVMSLAGHWTQRADFTHFTGGSDPLRNLQAIARGVWLGESRAVMQAGVILLIATPIARVFLTLLVFLHQRDRIYVALTFMVLGLLAWGLLGHLA